jgi:hypothetical protein
MKQAAMKQVAMKQVTDVGGKVIGEPLEIPGVGQYVSFFDPEGNRVSMLQAIPRQRQTGDCAHYGASNSDDLWPEVFCAGLADRGFRVIRFGNRAIGLSTSAMRRCSPPVRAISANRHRRDRQQLRPTHLDKSH